MAHTRGDVVRTLGLGATMVVLTALACLAFAASRDARPLSLAELAQTETLPMSCDGGFATTTEPLWCADPSAPQCAPAAPDAPPVMIAASPDVWLYTSQLPQRVDSFLLVPWPRPLATSAITRVDQARIERPPRG